MKELIQPIFETDSNSEDKVISACLTTIIFDGKFIQELSVNSTASIALKGLTPRVLREMADQLENFLSEEKAL